MDASLKELRDSLQQFLATEIVSVKFIKANGEERIMKCTLNPSLIKDTYEKKTERVKKENEEVVGVWDVEKQAWRSFRIDSVKAFSLTFYETAS